MYTLLVHPKAAPVNSSAVSEIGGMIGGLEGLLDMLPERKPPA